MFSRIQTLILVCVIAVVLNGCMHGGGAFYFGNYSEAENLFNRGEYDKAIQKYQAYIDENPEGHLAIISQYYMAKSHAALGHKEEAEALYKQIMEKYPNVVWANFSETQLKELGTQPDSVAPAESVSSPAT